MKLRTAALVLALAWPGLALGQAHPGVGTPNFASMSTDGAITAQSFTLNGTLPAGGVASNLTNTAFGLTTYAPFNGLGFNEFTTVFGAGAGGTALANGPNNTAIGYFALHSAVSASSETAVGTLALGLDVSGTFNTAVGTNALYRFTGDAGSAFGNTAIGHGAMGGDDVSPAANTGSGNVALGAWSLQEISTGFNNTCVGNRACVETQTGLNNVAVGIFANAGCAIAGCVGNIADVSAGNQNTAIGSYALQLNHSTNLTAVGAFALSTNSTGQFETAIGYQSLHGSVADLRNTAVGYNTLFALNGANDNTALGYQALFAATTGAANTCMGSQACSAITTSSNNEAFGNSALLRATTAANNIAIGNSALVNNLTGNDNTAVGAGSLFFTTGASNTAVGSNSGARVTGTGNLLLGFNAGAFTTTGSNNILVGSVDAPAGATSNWLNIGGAILVSMARPTVASGFGTGASVSLGSSSAAFQVNVGTGGVASSGVITVSPTAAPVTWACSAVDDTAPATSNTIATPTSTTTITLTNYSRTTGIATPWGASDNLTVTCFGY